MTGRNALACDDPAFTATALCRLRFITKASSTILNLLAHHQFLGCSMRTLLLASSIALCVATPLFAQQWQGQPYGYPTQGMPSPYPYGANPYGQPPTQAGPRVYYGDFPTAATPAPQPVQVPQPQPHYIPTQYSSGAGNGTVYYYYPSNGYNPTPYNYFPYGQLGRSTTAPLPSKAVGWPNPTPRYASPDAANDEPRAELDRLAALPFHRPTKDCFWVSGDYLASFIRPMGVASTLLTTGSTADALPGAFGQPGTAALFPRQNIDFGMISGLRLEAGVFLDDCDRFSLDLRGTWFTPSTSNYSAAADNTGRPFLARPVFNVAAGREGAFLNSSDGTNNVPAIILGTFNAEFKSELFGVELNARHHTYFWERFHADTLVGLRYMNLNERMRITERLTPSAASPPFLTFQGGLVGAPSEIADEDTFQTRNQFYGGQIGGRLSYEQKWFSLEGSVKLAIGATQQRTRIDGNSSLITPGGTAVVPGGILALPTNIGTYNRTVLGLIPEFGLNLGVDVTQHVRLQLGYSFLMWNKVVRPGSQFDRNLNPAQVPTSPTFGPFAGPIAPTYRFNDELFYAHSFNIGLLFHY